MQQVNFDKANEPRPVVALIATIPRYESLRTVAIPSILAQTHSPKLVVIVTDDGELTAHECQTLQVMLGTIQLIVLKNSLLPGAAGSWNTGITYIADHHSNSYIAILDDDDSWQFDHLELCLTSSERGSAHLVLSGVNVIKDGMILVQNIPSNLSVDDFVVGNPGWHGSNTFICARVIKALGGFTNGLISSNDRDFAIRLLSAGCYTVNYTGRASVNWNCGQHRTALSAPSSPQKRRGCAQFLQLHGHRMSRQQRERYFERMEDLFDLNEQDILSELDRLS